MLESLEDIKKEKPLQVLRFCVSLPITRMQNSFSLKQLLLER